MAYFVVQDFRGGLDQRRMDVTASPGTLRALQDAHVNRGGEIEKRKAFVSYAALPAGTKGMAALGGKLLVFGTGANVTVPSGITYQQLGTEGGTLDKILMTQPFNGKMYVVASIGGAVKHFYDGAEVTKATNRTDALTGKIIMTFGQKMYSAAGTVLYASGINAPDNYSEDPTDPTDDDPANTGSAFFDMGTQVAGAEDITGLGNYIGSMAVFSRRFTQIWTFSADPSESQQTQILRNIGTVSPLSVTSFADSDVFFLADSGVRSLKARDSSNSAAMSDVGTPIDSLIVEAIRTATTDELEAAHAAIEPTDGRFWLAFKDLIYCFSYFPTSKISAWSTYKPPAASEALAVVDNHIYMRAGDTIYVYGGTDGATYDDTAAVVELPYMDGNEAATPKQWLAFDAAALGTWDLWYSLDPLADADAYDYIGRFEGTTTSGPQGVSLGQSTLLKVKLQSFGSGEARLGKLIAHFNAGTAS